MHETRHIRSPGQTAELERSRSLLARERSQLRDLREGKEQVAKGEADIAQEAAALPKKQQAGEPLTIGKVDRAGVRMFSTTAEEWMLDAYYRPAPNPAVVAFFDTLVHDSKAAFLGGAEPWSYFRKRGEWESATMAERVRAREQAEHRRRMAGGM